MSDKNQSKFESELRAKLGRANCSVDIAHASFGEDEWKGYVLLAGSHFSLLVKEHTPLAQRAPFGNNLIAGHTPYSIAFWWQTFDKGIEHLYQTSNIITFRKAQMEPNVPREHYHHIGYGATYAQTVDGSIERSIKGRISTSPDSYAIEAHNTDCEWFKPISSKLVVLAQSLSGTNFAPAKPERMARLTLENLPTTRLIGAALAVARANEKWTIKP